MQYSWNSVEFTIATKIDNICICPEINRVETLFLLQMCIAFSSNSPEEDIEMARTHCQCQSIHLLCWNTATSTLHSLINKILYTCTHTKYSHMA